jgi:carbamoyl-phosphate synthase large subunit
VTRPAKIVITGAGTVTCQSVIKGLRTQTDVPVEIISVDASEQSAGRYFSDSFYKVPNASDPRFIDALIEICHRHEADLLIPIVDYEFGAVSASVDRFAAMGCFVAISPPAVITRVNNKLETYQFFQEHGFSSARTWSAAEARDERATLPYPLFLKPAVDGRSSIDCYRIQDESDLDLYIDRVPNALVQEYVNGPEYTADLIAGRDSQVYGVVVRERIETKGGVSYKGRTVDDPEMTSEVIRMASHLGIVGPANIQAFRQPGTDGTSRLLFNEINPRFSGALALTLAAGLNSPLILIKIALDLPVVSQVGMAQTGVTMLRYWNEVFVGADGKPIYPDYHLDPNRLYAGAL